MFIYVFLFRFNWRLNEKPKVCFDLFSKILKYFLCICISFQFEIK